MRKENSQWHLPLKPEYRNWSKKLIREQVGKDPYLTPYLCTDADYGINPNTLVIYQFQNQPLLGKYKSVIFDRSQGIVLSRRSSCALMTAFGRRKLLAGLEFQRYLARKLKFRGSNVIATGRLAYFCTRSYNQGNVDWIALHQMVDEHNLSITSLAFKTLDRNYCFNFAHCIHYIGRQLSPSLTYNHLLCELIQAHLQDYLGWQIKLIRGQSLIDQPVYFLPCPAIAADQQLKDVIKELLQEQQLRHLNELSDYYELPFLRQTDYPVFRFSCRLDTLY